MNDVFGAAGIRERVLAGWTASAARFREDANAEEDLALGGYRDRLVVELAQNAADAAARAGVPGRVRFTLYDTLHDAGDGPTLVVANTGSPLTADGVESLATLRASAKRTEPAGSDGSGSGGAGDGAVGRFGVGFAAVLAVTDEPAVLSRTGGVRFSRADTAAAVEAAAADVDGPAVGLADEVRRRDGQMPVLRLPFEAAGEPPEGFDTAVLLPLRDEAAADLVRRLLAEADDALLLALPGLDRIEIDVDGNESVLTDAAARWHVHRTGGVFGAEESERLLADRPTEERARPFWSVLWALPKDPAVKPPRTVHAPTPTDEPLSLPGLLLASFPLDPARRHVATGPLTDRLVGEAATAYAELLRARAEDGADVLPLVPTGIAAGALDASLRQAIITALPATPLLRPAAAGPDAVVASGTALARPVDVGSLAADSWDALAAPTVRSAEAGVDAVVASGTALPQPVDVGALAADSWDALAAPAVGSAEAGADAVNSAGAREGVAGEGVADRRRGLLRGRDAVVVDGADDAFVGVLAAVVGGLVRAGRADRAALEVLGVRRMELAEVVDLLGQVAEARPVGWWRAVYGAVAGMVADPLTREALGALPVPLADGRVVRGARGLLLPGEGLRADVLAALGPYGLRVVHPDAVHETLERLGAVPAGPRALLADGAVRAAVEHSEDADDPDAIADAVLAIAAAGGADPADRAWLGDLMLRAADGELVPAGVLVVPGSEAEAVLDDEEFAPADPALAERYGLAALEAVGVLRTLGVVTATDVALDALPDELDLDDVEGWAGIAPAASTAGEVVAVRDLEWVTDWPRALALFGSDPALRAALLDPVRVTGPDHGTADIPSYTSWWIRNNVQSDDGPDSTGSDGMLAGRADPEADAVLAELLDPAPAWVAECDPAVRAAIGLVRRVAELDADGVELLLLRLAEQDRAVPVDGLLELWAALGTLADYPGEPPARVRVLGPDGSTRVVAAGEAVVGDAPMWLQRTDLGGFVLAAGPAADGLADLLDLPLAADVAAGRVDSDGTPAAVPAAVRRLLPGGPDTWWEHEELVVDGNDVSWWVTPDGSPHAATGDGLAKALAWSAGAWSRRHEIRTVLTDPALATDLLLDAAFD